MEHKDKNTRLLKRYNRLNDHFEQVYYGHKCNDISLVLCKRVYKNGSEAYVYQCDICGYQKGGALKKEKALQVLNNRNLQIFQTDLTDTYQNRRKKLLRILYTIKRKMAGKDIIKDVPTKDFETKHKEELDLMKNLYSQLKKIYKFDSSVHTFLGQFRSFVNNEYIVKNHLEDTKIKRFRNEDEVKSWFVDYFREDFYIEDEVGGYHITEKQNVKIDFLIYPRKHLIDNGFISHCIGIEVKYIDPMSENLTKKANKALWQTISYNDCLFTLKSGKRIQPKFCMVFSNLSFDHEEKLYTEFPHAHNKRIWFYYLLLANHANVGELRIRGDRNSPTGWSFRFGNSGVYFRRQTNYENENIYEVSNSNLATKKRVGNFQ